MAVAQTVLKCWLSPQRAQPLSLFASGRSGTQRRVNKLEDGDERRHHGYRPGCLHCGKAHTEEADLAKQTDLTKCVVVRMIPTRLIEVGMLNHGSRCPVNAFPDAALFTRHHHGEWLQRSR